MAEETATPEEAPVDLPSASDNALAEFLAEDDTPSEPDDNGDGEQPPATEGDAQKAEGEDAETLPGEQPKYKVKVRGEELEVPLDELLNGYSRTEDYKAKTAEVAEQRRQAATEYADKLEQQVQLFTALDPVLSQTMNLDWAALARHDPTSYVQLKAAHDERLQVLQSAMGEIGQIRQAEASKEAEAQAQYYQAEREALFQAAPELKDPAKLEGFARGVVDYLKAQGFDDRTITETADHRAMLIADKARKWDELQKAQTTVESKKVAPKPQQTLKPRAAESPRAPKRPGPTSSDADRRAWVLSQLDAE